MSLAIRGNDFNFFFTTKKPKIQLVGRKWTQKSTLLGVFGVFTFGVFTFSIFFWEKTRGFFFFFFKCLQLLGGTILIFFHYQKAKNIARRSKMDSKIDTFGRIWRIYLFNFFLGKNARFFFSFFLNVFSYQGERF